MKYKRKNKKILLIRSNPYDLNPNTYNIQEIGIGKAFCNIGYDFDYITFKKYNQKEWVFYKKNDCRAKWIEKPRLRFLRWGLNFDICKKEFLSKYDLVICREYYQYITYKVVKSHNNVIIYNGPYWNMFIIKPFSMIYDCLARKAFNEKASGIVTKSNLSTEYLLNKGYKNIKTIGVALDTSRFDNDVAPDKQTKEIIKFMKKNECILYVGNIDKNKNYKFLLDVYSDLKLKNTNLKLVVIGKSKQDIFHKIIGFPDSTYESGCYKNYTKEIIDGIYRIRTICNEQLRYIYPLAKVLLLPSKKEIFGMVLLEAMYLGAPVVTSMNGGSSTLIKNGQNGIIINDFDKKKWVNEVNKIMYNKKNTKKIIINAKKTIKQKYRWDILVKSMIKQSMSSIMG